MSDTRSFITTRPQCEPCPRCGQLQLTGHAEGLTYRADPVPLTPHGELAARQTGRATYALIADGLTYRSATRIHGDIHRPRPPVLAAHHCQHPPEPQCVDAAHVPAVTRLVQRTQRADDTTPAPLTETESDALFLITRELGGRVIAHEPHGSTDAPY